MIYNIKSKSKHLNLKRIKFVLTWFKIPIKLIPINLKWLIAMIGYNKLTFSVYNLYAILISAIKILSFKLLTLKFKLSLFRYTFLIKDVTGLSEKYVY